MPLLFHVVLTSSEFNDFDVMGDRLAQLVQTGSLSNLLAILFAILVSLTISAWPAITTEVGTGRRLTSVTASLLSPAGIVISGGAASVNLAVWPLPGEFPDAAGNMWMPAGIILNKDISKVHPVDQGKIAEYVDHSWFENSKGAGKGLHPWEGETEVSYTGPKAPYTNLDTDKKYSFVKSPRYEEKAMEVGPLARVLVAYCSGHKETKAVAGWVLDQVLVLLHPFMPFITEELWHGLKPGRSELIVAQWPVPDARALDREAGPEIDWLIRLVSGIRAARAAALGGGHRRWLRRRRGGHGQRHRRRRRPPAARGRCRWRRPASCAPGARGRARRRTSRWCGAASSARRRRARGCRT